LWEWDGATLVGWIATGPTPTKVAHLDHSPYVSVNYWADNHDTCTAECRAEWHFDDETRVAVWKKFRDAPAPVGYDPAIIPAWKDGPDSPEFGVLKLMPWRIELFAIGQMATGQEPAVWRP
jgi:hypothetical protein